MRGEGNASQRVDHETEDHSDAKQDQVAEKFEYAEHIWLVGARNLLLRIELAVLLIEEFSLEFLSVYVPDLAGNFSGA